MSSKPIIELSYSSWNDIKTCPRRYQLRKRFQQPQYAWDTGLPAVGGQAIHEYIQTKMSGYSEQEALMAMFYAFDFEVEANDSDWNKLYRNFEACIISAKKGYIDLGLDPDELAQVEVNGAVRPAVELKFNLIISHDSLKNDYHYRGAIDLVKYQQFMNKYTAVDIKTHRNYKENSTEDASHKYKYDDQLIPYGLIVAHINNSKLPNFATQYLTIFVDALEPTVKEYTFNRTIEDIKAWHDKLMLQIFQIEVYASDETWPRTHNGCEFYMKPCKHFSRCDITDHEVLQDDILGNGRYDPKPNKPFGEWFTVELETI